MLKKGRRVGQKILLQVHPEQKRHKTHDAPTTKRPTKPLVSPYVLCSALHGGDEKTLTVQFFFYGTAPDLSRAVPRGMQAIGRPTIPGPLVA